MPHDRDPLVSEQLGERPQRRRLGPRQVPDAFTVRLAQRQLVGTLRGRVGEGQIEGASGLDGDREADGLGREGAGVFAAQLQRQTALLARRLGDLS